MICTVRSHSTAFRLGLCFAVASGVSMLLVPSRVAAMHDTAGDVVLRATHASVQHSDSLRLARRARGVMISRDEYGIPHVSGQTDADAVFGFAYAQAEDNLWRIEENFILSLGRAAEIHGETALAGDRVNRALGIGALAIAEYRRLPSRVRALCDAYADGVNFYLATHPRVQRRLLDRVEPWYPLAFIRYNYYQNGFARDGAMSGAALRTSVRSVQDAEDPFRWPRRVAGGLSDNVGSNGWVIGPSRSASGYPLLFINPHLGFLGSSQVYEGHVRSAEGWNFTGYTRLGFPFPYVGHGSSLGWVSTDNYADQVDVYAEVFDDPARPLAYRYGTGYRIATERIDTIGVRTARGLELRTYRSVRTHHGPILAERNGRLLAIRMAHFEDDGWLGEWYAMTRARTVAELRRAMTPLRMLFGNVMAADTAGHIFYLYNGAVPRRDPRHDWTAAVDGSDVTTEWHGYHSIDELPQLLDPPSGWMQNCNTSPFALTSDRNPDSTRFPSYMVRDGMNARGVRARQILGTGGQNNGRFAFDEWTRLAFDTRVGMADSLLSQMIAGARSSAMARTRRDVTEALDSLERWDHRADTLSVATTLFTRWREAQRQQAAARRDQPVASAGERLGASLASALDSLTARAGTWHVRWGTVNRLQRLSEPEGQRFSDSLPSVAVPGVNGADGAVFTFYTEPGPGVARFGNAGATYVSVAEFGPRVRALSIHTYGASGDRRSPHFFDQAPLYARGQFRGSWLTEGEVRAHARRSYRPGT